jgi:hypothetical protein
MEPNKELDLRHINIKGETLETIITKSTNVTKFLKLETCKDLDIGKIRKGILFLYAEWAPTLVFFKILIESLKDFNLDDIEVISLNVDGISIDYYQNELRHISKGIGEVFWIKEGQIVHQLLSFPVDYKLQIEKYTNDLL